MSRAMSMKTGLVSSRMSWVYRKTAAVFLLRGGTLSRQRRNGSGNFLLGKNGLPIETRVAYDPKPRQNMSTRKKLQIQTTSCMADVCLFKHKQSPLLITVVDVSNSGGSRALAASVVLQIQITSFK